MPNPLLFHRLVLLSAAMCALAAPPRANAADPDEKTVEQRWKIQWKEVANNYVQVGDHFYAAMEYRKEYPSSAVLEGRRVTEKSYADAEKLEQKYRDETNREKTRVLAKPPEEIEAAVSAMPKVEAGQYGRIHSGQVKTIVDGDEVILQQIWLVDKTATETNKQDMLHKFTNEDAEQMRKKLETNFPGPANAQIRIGIGMRFLEISKEAGAWWFKDRDAAIARQDQAAFRDRPWHIVGFKTDKLKQDARWPSGDSGVSLTIIKVEADRIIAAPTARLEAGLTEDKVQALLDERKITRAAFVAIVTEAKRRDAKNYLPLVLAALENEGKLPEPDRPAKPGKPGAAPAKPGNDVELAP